MGTISVEHLKALVMARFDGDENEERRLQLLSLITSKMQGARKELLEALDEAKEGTSKYLDSAWRRVYGTIHLFRVPKLTKPALQDAIESWPHSTKGDTTLFKYSTEPAARVLSVIVRDGTFEFTVRIKKPITWPEENGRGSGERIVDVAVDIRPTKKIAIAHANVQDAMKAVRAIVERQAGLTLPRGDKRVQYLSPLKFSESNAKAVARKQSMKLWSMRGFDPNGDARIVESESSPNGDLMAPVDLSKPVIRAQDGAPRDLRTYVFTHTHPDGYPENALVKFSLKGHTHLSFPMVCSSPSAESVIEALLLEVGV